MTSTPFPKVANRAKKQIELIHSDICGPMPTATPNDHRYMMTFIDDYSRFTVVYLLKTKDEAVDRIKDYVATLHTKFGRNPVTLRTDNGRETLVEMAKCMLTDAKLPERFWGEAVCTAAYLQNRLPSRSISKTPFELWTGIKPNVEHIRIFGSKAYSYIPKQKRRKWGNKAREGVIVGYSGSKKGYRLLNPRTNEIWISHSVKIIEDDSHMKNESAVPKGAIERSWEYDDIPKLLKKEDNVIIEDIFGPTQEELSGEVEPIKDGIEAPTLRRSRRINNGIPPKRLSYNIRATQICEPTSWEEIIKLPARERNKWIAAAEEEMTSLKRKDVFELVEPPDGCNVISSKWIFNAKRDASGEDYDETFAPVVKHETIRTLLSIAAVKSLHVRHFDVKCAYLNAELPEKLYMEQPPGLPDSYSALVTVLEGRDEADLTVEYVSGKLLDEYQWRTESCLDQSSNEVALNTTASNARSQFRASKATLTKSDNESRRCYYCGKKGHIKANCCKLKLQREKDEKARYGVHHNELFPINQETNAMQYRTFATREKAYKGKIGDWYVDSGATSHMTCNRNFFESLEQRKSTVYLADNTAIQTEGIGHGWLFCVTPDAQRITNNGYKIMFQDDTCLTSYQKEVVAEAKLDGSLFKLKQKHQIDTALNPEAIRKLNREQLANSIDIRKCDAENDCEICLTAIYVVRCQQPLQAIIDT
ncbi:Retrovirus-related Pol polyprotein from transposon TNT 1-94 [Trichinella sp. T9]|nr:Retrovirus-related Pol polyprotein from transposon TNT 1-94 [Trichinella sp. T9]